MFKKEFSRYYVPVHTDYMYKHAVNEISKKGYNIDTTDIFEESKSDELKAKKYAKWLDKAFYIMVVLETGNASNVSEIYHPGIVLDKLASGLPTYTPDRRPGFYWVLKGDVYMVAYWDGACWIAPTQPQFQMDSDFSWIDQFRLTQPSYTPSNQ